MRGRIPILLSVDSPANMTFTDKECPQHVVLPSSRRIPEIGVLFWIVNKSANTIEVYDEHMNHVFTCVPQTVSLFVFDTDAYLNWNPSRIHIAQKTKFHS